MPASRFRPAGLLALAVLAAACSGGGAPGTSAPATTAATTTTAAATTTTAAATTSSAPTTTTEPITQVNYDGPPPALWVTHPQEGLISRIDAATGEVLDTLEVGGLPQDILYAEGAVWVVDSPAGNVLRIDPATLTVDRLDAGPWPYRLTAMPGMILVTNVTEEGSVTVLRATDGAKVATLPVGEYPTATAVVAGPPTDRAQTGGDWWYLWVAHSHELLYYYLLNPLEVPYSHLFTLFAGPPFDPTGTPPSTTTTTTTVPAADRVQRAYDVADAIEEADHERRAWASDLADAAAALQEDAQAALGILDRFLAAARAGDKEAAQRAAQELGVLLTLHATAPEGFNRALAAFRAWDADFYRASAAMRQLLSEVLGTADEAAVNRIAGGVSETADLSPHLRPPSGEDPRDLSRDMEEARVAGEDAVRLVERIMGLMDDYLGRLDRGEAIPDDPYAVINALYSGWPTEDPGASLDPGTGLEDLVPFGSGLYGFSWNGGGLVGFDPFTGRVQQQWGGPGELSGGFTGGGVLWGVAPGDGLWTLDGFDFSQYLEMPGLAAAAPWWNAIYAASDTGDIYTVGYEGGAASLLIGGLPPISGIAVQPPPSIIGEGVHVCPRAEAVLLESLAPDIRTDSTPGFGEPCDEYGAFTSYLDVRLPEQPWDPGWNPLVLKCRCP